MYRSIKICGRNFGTHNIRYTIYDFEQYLEFVTITKKLRKNDKFDIDELYIIERDIHGEVFRLSIYPTNMLVYGFEKYILSKEEWVEKLDSDKFLSNMISSKD